MPPSNYLLRTRDKSQESWASGSGGDREEECEDEGAQDDREYSLGWQDEGSQANLSGSFGDGDLEADLGTTEEIDQMRRLEIAAGVMAGLDEPCLGWAESAGKGIVGPQNCLDDRQHDDERELDLAEHARNLLRKANDRPPFVETATKLPDNTVVRRFAPREENLVMVPEIDFRAHYHAAHGRSQ